MIINKKVSKEIEEIEDVVCDKCGDSCKLAHYSGDYCGGYFSTHIPDGVAYTFDVCEKCLLEWMKTFKRDVCENAGYRDQFE